MEGFVCSYMVIARQDCDHLVVSTELRQELGWSWLAFKVTTTATLTLPTAIEQPALEDTHPGEKSNKCNQCDFGLSQTSNLKTRMVQIQGYRHRYTGH